MLKLFIELIRGDIFHFWDSPERKLIKFDRSSYISPEGLKKSIHPFVAIFTEEPKNIVKSIYDQTKGSLDG